MGNGALLANPSTGADEHQTVRGSDWYWTVTTCMGASAIVFAVMASRVPRGERIFHYIITAIVTVAAIAYYTMGANLGWAPVRVEYLRTAANVRGTTRQVFYARYIDWFITTPLLLLDLLLLAGLPKTNILWALFLDLVMIVTGLVGALTSSRYKWGYYAFGCAAWMMINWEIAFVGHRSARAIGDDAARAYMIVAGWLILLWLLYPIAWGLAEGGNYITSDSEAIFYGILDLLAKPVFGFMTLWAHKKIGLKRLGLGSKYASPGVGDTSVSNGTRDTPAATTGTRV